MRQRINRLKDLKHWVKRVKFAGNTGFFTERKSCSTEWNDSVDENPKYDRLSKSNLTSTFLWSCIFLLYKVRGSNV